MDSRRVDAIIRHLARSQHGLLTFAQCRDAGVDATQLANRLDRGVLDRVSPVVMRLAGAPVSPESGCMAAVLDAGPGAAVSHQTAAAMWGLPGFARTPVHVTAIRTRVRRTSSHLAVVHEPRAQLPHHTTELDGVPVVTPSRMVFELAGSPWMHPLRLERVVDTALSRRLVSVKSLERVLLELGGRGRAGTVAMRELLATRRSDYRPAESGLEARFAELLARAGMSGFERQVDVGDEEGWVGRVDFIDKDAAIIVETDTALHHGSITDRRHDELRRQRLRAAGWTVIAVTDVDVFQRPDEVVARLREAAGSTARRRNAS